MFNGYKNKYFSILGDSISTLEGYSQPRSAVYYDTSEKIRSGVITFSDTWWGRVIETLGGKLLVNNSFSGSTVCWYSTYEIPSYACSDERTSALDRGGISPDVIMVYMGTNDWGNGFRIAQNKTRDSREYPAFFASAYAMLLKKLRARYPQAEIWCLTLPISRCTAQEDFQFPYYFAGRHIDEYCAAIRDCAREHGCLLIDLRISAVSPDTVDGFHPTAEGMKTIAEGVLKELQNAK